MQKTKRERDHIYKSNCDEVQVFHELKDAHQFISSYEVENTLKFLTFYSRTDFGKTGYWFSIVFGKFKGKPRIF